MKDRVKTLQTVARLQNCNVELARQNHARITQLCARVEHQTETLTGRIGAAEAAQREQIARNPTIAIDTWQRAHEHLAMQERSRRHLQEQQEVLRDKTAQALAVLTHQSQSLKVTERLKERAEVEIARDTARRDDKAMDELWLLGEESRQ